MDISQNCEKISDFSQSFSSQNPSDEHSRFKEYATPIRYKL